MGSFNLYANSRLAVNIFIFELLCYTTHSFREILYKFLTGLNGNRQFLLRRIFMNTSNKQLTPYVNRLNALAIFHRITFLRLFITNLTSKSVTPVRNQPLV